MTQDGTKKITNIFGSKKFNFPKPSSLIQYILEISTYRNKNSIVLDSFAGSGTTAHAVLKLNQQDGGQRQCILIEMEDYAESITAERVRRVMDGYGEGNKQVEGTGGSFAYYTMGPSLFDEGKNLNEEVGIEAIREYIWFSETHSPYRPPLNEEENTQENAENTEYFLGTHNETAYYFIYEKDRLTALDYDSLAQMKTKVPQYIIYADTCLLPQNFMLKHSITFRKIPRDIKRF